VIGVIPALSKTATGLAESMALSRSDPIELRVERATGPFCRATSPTAVRTTTSPNSEQFLCVRLGGKLPPRTAKLAVPPRPTAWFRLSAFGAVRSGVSFGPCQSSGALARHLHDAEHVESSYAVPAFGFGLPIRKRIRPIRMPCTIPAMNHFVIRLPGIGCTA